MSEAVLAWWPQGLSLGAYLGMGMMVVAGACLQGVGGLGFAMFCAPMAALWFPELVPGPLLAVACPLALLAAWRERNSIEWRTAGFAIAGRLVGTGLAAACLALLPVRALSLLFALLILTGVTLSLRGWQVPLNARNTTLAGMASGLMGTITSAGAPPFAIAMQHMPPQRLRATIGAIFFIGGMVSLIALAIVGRMRHLEAVLSLLLMPWMVAGFALSSRLKNLLPGHRVRQLLLAMAAGGAFAVLVQTFARA